MRKPEYEVARVGAKTELPAESARQIIGIIGKAQDAFVNAERVTDAFAAFLDDLLDFTGSEYGFIGEVMTAADGSRFLKTHAITDISWDEASKALFEKNAADGLEFRNLDTLFGRTVMTGERILTNDPAGHPAGGGLPPGHPPLRTYAGLPMMSGGRLIGMIALANRASGYYEALVDELEPLLRTCANLIEAHRSDVRRRAAEDMLQEALENIPEGFVIYDADDRLVIWNSAYGDIYKESEGQLKVGSTFESMLRYGVRNGQYPAAGTTESEHEAWVEARLNQHNNPSGPVQQELPDGQWLRIDERRTPNGLLVGMRTNITELKETEAMLRQANENLSRFAYVAAHDLQEPLRKIQAFSEMLEDGLSSGNTEDVEYALSVMTNAATRARGLVKDLLDYSRTTNHELKMQEVELETIFSDVLSALADAIGRSGAEIELHLNDAVLIADPTQLGQLLQNLISNAIKYVAEDVRPRVRIQVFSDAEGRPVSLIISDNGIGFDQRLADRIFEPFQRLHTREEYAGTGIGLAICAAVAERHGWRIWAESRKGEGSAFHVDFAAN